MMVGDSIFDVIMLNLTMLKRSEKTKKTTN